MSLRPTPPDIAPVRAFFEGLQANLVHDCEAIDGGAHFVGEELSLQAGGISRPRVLQDGERLEKAAVQFTHSVGAALPPAATDRNPHLAGKPFQATAVSVIVHPRNPYAPTAHMNLRFFLVDTGDASTEGSHWHFGGGFDLTPCYGFEEDARHWHQVAFNACCEFGEDVYPKYKKWCDEYFFIRHRGEARGVGGLFFDDLNEWGFDRCFDFLRSVGDHYMRAYRPIVERRKDTLYTDQQKDFQLYRRGRYVEFNLVYDRGTLFGLQSGGRVESILMSLPPRVQWQYNRKPEPGTEEARLVEEFLTPRDWLEKGDNRLPAQG